MSIKNIYLGQVSAEMLQAFGEEGYFDFQGLKWSLRMAVDLESGMAQLWDSVGRMVPFDKEVYEQMAAALDIMQAGQSEYDKIAESVQEAESELDYLLEDLLDFGMCSDGFLVV